MKISGFYGVVSEDTYFIDFGGFFEVFSSVVLQDDLG